MKRTHFLLMTAAIAVLMAGIAIFTSCNKDDEKNGDATGSIYGTVTDLANGEPVSNVNVKLKPSGEATLTGSDGTYEFKDIKAGKYTLSFSKAEYADLDDDYVIELEAGRSAKRDVQIQKQMAVLRITDMEGNPIPSLDFGMDEAVVSKSFNIFNNGTVTIDCELSHNCAWISQVVAAETRLAPGQTLAVTIVINRSKLSSGENRTYLQIKSKNGNNELLITATGYGVPTVTTDEVSSINAISAVCGGNVTYNGGYEVTERGLCWSSTNIPFVESDNKKTFGAGTGTFSGAITGLTPNTTYYIRAYAKNAKGVAYGEQKQFTTADGLPKVTTTTATLNGDVIVSGGNVTDDGGYAVTARGICYGTLPYPDLSNTYTHTENGTGKGYFTSTFPKKNEKVYVRAYATNANGTAYGEQVIYDPEYVNLGLTSGTKWKRTNAEGFYTYDDAVSAYGDNLPTKAQWDELRSQCQWSWTGSGYKVTGPNGNSITLPAAGHRNCGGYTDYVGSSGYYWSSTPDGSSDAWYLYFGSSSVYMYSNGRCYGSSVRLVEN